MGLDEFFGLREVVEVKPKEWMHDHEFTLLDTEEALKAYVDRACASKLCALDIETTGLDTRRRPSGETVDQIVGYCMSYDGHEGVYVPVRHRQGGASHNLEPDVVFPHIQRLLDVCVCIFHNTLFDHEILEGAGYEVGGIEDFEDTLILSYLHDSSSKRHGLKSLSSRHLGLEMIELPELFDESLKDYNFSTLDPSDMATLWYAGADAICTYKLYVLFDTHYAVPRLEYPRDEHGKVVKGAKQLRVVDLEPCEKGSPPSVRAEQKGVYSLERGNVAATRWMERNRPHIDLDYLSRVRYEVQEYTQEVCEQIAQGFSGFGFPMTVNDVSKPATLGAGMDYLHGKGLIKAELVRTEKSGQVKTSDDVIEALCEKVGDTFPFLKLIRTYRGLQKVDSTYLGPLQTNTDGYRNDALPRNPSHVLQDESTHFSFNPHRVDTGRFAASKGKWDHGYSGINVQSAPACYNRGKFASKLIISRPKGPGNPDAVWYESFDKLRGVDFLARVYDNHFVLDTYKNEERCVAKSCEGCPFQESCTYEDEPFVNEEGIAKPNTKMLSLDSSVRPAIKARPGFVIVAIDQSGVELRLAANLSGEPRWINEFFRCSTCKHEFNDERYSTPVGTPPALCPKCGSDKIGDLHTLTTQIVYGDEVLRKPDFKKYRQNSKGANFSVLYGGGGSAVARATGVSRDEGAEIKEKMLSGLPKLRAWISDIHKECAQNKQVKTAVGRRIRLPDIDNHDSWISAKAQRNAVNGIIQGSATGDLTKYGMWRIFDWLKANDKLDDCRLMICIHDELVFEMRKDKLDELVPVIVEKMTDLGRALKWPVPLRCDIELGPTFDVCYNWSEFHPYNPSVRAPEPVPESLWRHIEFEPGMWYINEQGEEVLPRGLLAVDEETGAEVLVKDDICDFGDAYMSYQNKTSKYLGGPILTYRLHGNPLAPLDERGSMHSVMVFRQIRDFCATREIANQTLRLESWDGEVLVSEDVGWGVETEAVRLLADFLGLRGEIRTP